MKVSGWKIKLTDEVGIFTQMGPSTKASGSKINNMVWAKKYGLMERATKDNSSMVAKKDTAC